MIEKRIRAILEALNQQILNFTQLLNELTTTTRQNLPQQQVLMQSPTHEIQILF